MERALSPYLENGYDGPSSQWVKGKGEEACRGPAPGTECSFLSHRPGGGGVGEVQVYLESKPHKVAPSNRVTSPASRGEKHSRSGPGTEELPAGAPHVRARPPLGRLASPARAGGRGSLTLSGWGRGAGSPSPAPAPPRHRPAPAGFRATHRASAEMQPRDLVPETLRSG